MKKTGIIVFLFLAAAFIFSCKKITNPEPGPPVIAFKDFNVVSEKLAYFHFTFTDPDGDIGLKNSDTTGAFKYGSQYFYDFHMEIYKYDSVNNVFVPGLLILPPDTYGFFNNRIPFIDNKSKDKSLTGEVYVELDGFRPASWMKRFKYKFYIYDRAHHMSNVVTTPEFNQP